MERIEPFIAALMGTSNLNTNQAKTLFYYCLMTWTDKPKKRPILVLDGESGTGKSDLMDIMLPWCRVAERIDAERMSEAVLRDLLADTVTAFVEEADKTADPAKCEGWYKMRYEETGKRKKYKRQTVNPKGYTINLDETHDHYGYTIMHVQNAFQSTEMDRRTLKIVIFKDSDKKYKVTKVAKEKMPVEVLDKIDWHAEVEQEYSGSAWDVWLPLMRIATQFKDTEWLEYARKQIDLKTQEDALSKIYELKGIVFSEIIPLYDAALKGANKRIAITEIRGFINDRGYYFTEKQIAKAARDLGFTVYYPQNKAHIKVEGQELLDRTRKIAGFPEDEDSKVEAVPVGVLVG